jgi:hypothetical protein
MGLNVSESTAVFTVVDYIIGRARRSGFGVPTEQEAMAALALLADGGHKRLQAGVTGDYVREHWHRRRVADGETARDDRGAVG